MGITASGETRKTGFTMRLGVGPSPDTTAKKWTTSPDSLAGLGAWVLLAMILALPQDLAAQDRCHLEFRCGGPPGRESEQRQFGASL